MFTSLKQWIIGSRSPAVYLKGLWVAVLLIGAALAFIWIKPLTIVQETSGLHTRTADNSEPVTGESILVSVPIDLGNKDSQQWEYVEWSLTSSLYEGNPYDVVATVTFEHEGTGERRTTPMFYAGGDTWKFRFTGTRPGSWTFTTSSVWADLDERSGVVEVEPNPGGRGFVTHFGNKWGWMGTEEVFVPQLVMYSGPQGYHNKAGQIDADIQTFMVEHGFNGFHTPVFCRWFAINESRCDRIDDPVPDPRTFEALELLITKVHAAGGVVHIWVWGDEDRRQTPLRWGINGVEDRRLQRYIAARLGPLPGWTMGYGFDLWEWVNGRQLTEWHSYMHTHLGWPHMLGGRWEKNRLTQATEVLDYSGYEQHQPDYAKYVETIEMRPEKPSFSEDRFRMRDPSPYPDKDYSMELTRRGLWHSTMAGGVANIWGNLTGTWNGLNCDGSNLGLASSCPYPNKNEIKTYSLFFKHRFLKDLERCNDLTDGVCLKRPNNKDYILYKEDTSSIRMKLSGMQGPQPAVAVDTKKAYAEIVLGTLTATDQTWTAPYTSDWIIAIGDFRAP